MQILYSNPLAPRGMTITKEYLTEAGGTIDVETDLGHGSKFIITLPLVAS